MMLFLWLRAVEDAQVALWLPRGEETNRCGEAMSWGWTHQRCLQILSAQLHAGDE